MKKSEGGSEERKKAKKRVKNGVEAWEEWKSEGIEERREEDLVCPRSFLLGALAASMFYYSSH